MNPSPNQRHDLRDTQLSPATIITVRGPREVSLSFSDGTQLDAVLAIAHEYLPREGDRVLVASGNEGAWVVGVLSALRSVHKAVSTDDGTSAQLSPDGSSLQVTDAHGKLLFEHRPEEGQSILSVPHGDLRLRSEQGSIELESANDIRFRAGRDVALEAQRGRVELDQMHFTADSMTSTIEKVRQTLGVVETRATRIIERAKNVYREVEELQQTRAGRVRMIAKKTFQVMGRRTLFKAKEDVSIKGEKIYLA